MANALDTSPSSRFWLSIMEGEHPANRRIRFLGTIHLCDVREDVEKGETGRHFLNRVLFFAVSMILRIGFGMYSDNKPNQFCIIFKYFHIRGKITTSTVNPSITLCYVS